MPDPSSLNESQKMLSWLNKNRRILLELYRNEYVAYNAERLIAHSENLQEVLSIASATGEPFLIYLVPRTNASIQILPIQFREGIDSSVGEISH